MDTLEKAALAYFAGPDSRQLAHALLAVLSAAAAVFLSRGSWRLNRLQFLLSGILIYSLWVVAAMVIQAAIPAMISSPTPLWAEPQPTKNGWVLMLADLTTCAAVGLAWGMAAMARCRDSFGKNDKAFAMIAVVGATLATPLVYVALLLRGTKKKSDKRWTEAPGLSAEQEAPAITGRNSLDDPIVIPNSLLTNPRDYVRAEYAFISHIHANLKEEWKVTGQALMTSNGRYVDRVKVAVRKIGQSSWIEEREYYFDVTSGLKAGSRY